MKALTVIPGDGIGPEVMNAVVEVLKKVNAPFSYDFQDAGEVALKKHGELLPKATLASIDKSKLAIKGPTSTPVGGGHKSINVTLRQTYDLYSNVRPVISLPGVKCVYPDVNLTIVRENTEDLYTGIEQNFNAGTDEEVAEGIKRITKKGSRRIALSAFQLAQKTGRNKVTVVHKANIMKMTDGLFLKTCQEVGKDFPGITVNDLIVDNCCMQLVTKPQQFEVVVTENLYGDILSDLCAGLVGGLGIVPGANIGDNVAIFEAVHGSAPDIAGQGKANPTALLQSAILLLEHCQEMEKATKVRAALMSALQDKSVCTADVGGQGNTQKFTQAILARL